MMVGKFAICLGMLGVIGATVVQDNTDRHDHAYNKDSIAMCPVGGKECTNPLGEATGCCSDADGVCCPDSKTCCPSGYECGDGECVATDPSKHPYVPFTPPWNLCHGPMSRFQLPDVTGADAASPLFLSYFATYDMMDAPKQQPKMAVVVVHGADRNADEYFCAASEAVKLQTYYDTGEVLVVAPWFKQPPDDIFDGEVYWRGDDPDGHWRAGEDSDPDADALEGRVVSSYAVLSTIVTHLQRITSLEQITVVGHSSGGQTVQRFAFADHAFRFFKTHSNTSTTSGGTIMVDTQQPHVRHVVMNPSSYLYFDNRRWNYTSPTSLPPWTKDELVVVSPPQAHQCPRFNEWEWGLDNAESNAPPYIAHVVQKYGRNRLIERYLNGDIAYLVGQNDTCNENLKPGCKSNGLEKTCMDMLQGPFRRYRALHYATYLHEYSHGRCRHSISDVPGSGHDHTLMLQSVRGLDAVFAPRA